MSIKHALNPSDAGTHMDEPLAIITRTTSAGRWIGDRAAWIEKMKLKRLEWEEAEQENDHE